MRKREAGLRARRFAGEAEKAARAAPAAVEKAKKAYAEALKEARKDNRIGLTSVTPLSSPPMPPATWRMAKPKDEAAVVPSVIPPPCLSWTRRTEDGPQEPILKEESRAMRIATHVEVGNRVVVRAGAHSHVGCEGCILVLFRHKAYPQCRFATVQLYEGAGCRLQSYAAEDLAPLK